MMYIATLTTHNDFPTLQASGQFSFGRQKKVFFLEQEHASLISLISLAKILVSLFFPL